MVATANYQLSGHQQIVKVNRGLNVNWQ